MPVLDFDIWGNAGCFVVCFSCRPILFSSYLSSTCGFQGYSYVSANAAAPRHYAPTCRISPPKTLASGVISWRTSWCDLISTSQMDGLNMFVSISHAFSGLFRLLVGIPGLSTFSEVPFRGATPEYCWGINHTLNLSISIGSLLPVLRCPEKEGFPTPLKLWSSAHGQLHVLSSQASRAATLQFAGRNCCCKNSSGLPTKESAKQMIWRLGHTKKRSSTRFHMVKEWIRYVVDAALYIYIYMYIYIYIILHLQIYSMENYTRCSPFMDSQRPQLRHQISSNDGKRYLQPWSFTFSQPFLHHVVADILSMASQGSRLQILYLPCYIVRPKDIFFRKYGLKTGTIP